MADFQQKSGGTPVSWLGGLLGGTDPIANIIPSKTAWQQAGQMALQPHVLANLYGGYNAPSIAPAQREATRHLREEVLPQLAHQWGGGGSTGGFLRGVQGAGSDLASKLGALQYEKQFELNKLRQEQLPKFQQLAQEENFQTHLTDKPINWGAADNPERQRTLSGQIAASPAGQAAAQIGGDLSQFAGQGVQRAGIGGRKLAGSARDWLSQPPRTQQELQQQRQQAQAAAQAARNQPQVRASEIPVPVADKIRKAYQYLEQETRPPAANVATANNPAAALAQKKADKEYGKPGVIQPELAQSMDTRHRRMIKSLKKMKGDVRKEFETALPLIKTTEQLEQFYNIAKSNPNRSKWQKFWDVMLPGFISKPLGLRGE